MAGIINARLQFGQWSTGRTDSRFKEIMPIGEIGLNRMLQGVFEYRIKHVFSAQHHILDFKCIYCVVEIV